MSTEEPQTDPQPEPTPEPSVEPTPTPDPDPEPKAPWTADDFDAERAWRLLQNKDADIAKEKAKRDQAVKDAAEAAAQKAREDAYREFGKSLGVVKDDETPTVEGLSQALQEKDSTLTAQQAENQALRIENAILRYAEQFGGDVEALTDSESFKAKLKALDPTAEDHAAKVADLVKQTVESNPRYRKVQVAASNSNGDPSPSGAPDPAADETSFEGLARRRAERRKNRLV